MPWPETDVLRERVRFIEDLESCLYTMSELSERYGVSRKTAYKWADRFAVGGAEDLRDRSRTPHKSPSRTPDEVRERLIEARRAHPTWGPRKLLTWLTRRRAPGPWPCPSTIGAVLKRAGLVVPRRRRRGGLLQRGTSLRPAAKPNDVWTIDFKGQFRLGDRSLCYPLTVMDRCSRYLVGVQGLPTTAGSGVEVVLERAFRRFGLPEAIRSDNGSPFASRGLAGLTRLSVGWLKLGIAVERIAPANPQQNGAHERMHRDLKRETAHPPAASAGAQQARFDHFRREYNQERPHDGLNGATPRDIYDRSPRPYPRRLSEPEYPGHYEVRSVRTSGEIRWRGKLLMISESLIGQHVGLVESDDGVWSLYFGAQQLARYDERTRTLR